VKYSLKELAKKLDVSAETLSGWLEKELFASSPARAEYFGEAAVREGEAIKKFLTMGYSLTEIAKIRKEIGLPLKDGIKTPAALSDRLTVGELAEQGGVNTRTIKFWEEKGLIQPCPRSEGGFRLFKVQDVELVKFIKDLQTFNYTLSEIGNILKLVGKSMGSAEDLERLSVDELEKIHSALEYLIARMRETRQASQRVEALFAKRLKAVERLFKPGKKSDTSV
jgi:DNA-binding transcriptional MerR regulator